MTPLSPSSIDSGPASSAILDHVDPHAALELLIMDIKRILDLFVVSGQDASCDICLSCSSSSCPPWIKSFPCNHSNASTTSPSDYMPSPPHSEPMSPPLDADSSGSPSPPGTVSTVTTVPTPEKLSPMTTFAPAFASSPEPSYVPACASTGVQPDIVDGEQPRKRLELEIERANQRVIISRRFWSKSVPGIDIGKYVERLHQYCPISPAVYLTTSVYLWRLCVVHRAVPLTPLNVHRLVLAALRVASKTLEDVNHPQRRFAKVGGLSDAELGRLEIGFLFLMGFDLRVDVDILEQQAAVLEGLATAKDAASMEQATNHHN
ncbi:cyclin-domain-containing protein [Lipomyces oligophaga]|uniref:cyclin-domain-containing protein n=1 Tax=Lipomyces oligophaga TaxID=45792 RepID=UPI0034CD3A30